MSRIDPTDAKQGGRGTHVFRILIATLILCVVAGIVVWIFGASQPDQSLPDASTGAGLTSPAPTTTPANPAATTVTPQGGNTAPAN